MSATALTSIAQAAVLPRLAGRVGLVTSRSGKRWVLPKGCLEPGRTAADLALLEAWEEAGLRGVLRQPALGTYAYDKDGWDYHVTVFAMDVTEAAADWPERHKRQRCWVTPAEAIVRVERQGLRRLLRGVLAAELGSVAV